MLTLTQASIKARKIIRYSIFFVIFLIVGKIVLDIGIAAYKKMFPAPPPAPTVSFGKLPKVPFPDRTKLNLTFTLETPEGGLPQTPEQTKVFYMPKLSANLLSLDFAKEKFSGLSYDPNPTQVSPSVYKFFHKTAPSTLETDIITSAFSVSYDLIADPSPLSARPPVPEVAASTIRGYLDNADLLPEDLTGTIKYQYLKQEGGNFVPALSLSDANLIRVYLVRKNYDELPIVSPTFNESNVWFMVSGLREKGKDIIAGEYHYFPVDETKYSTYPIKTADEAWDQFSSGNYYTAKVGSTTDGQKVKIRRVYLAYFDPGVYTQFLQPVFVFEGDGNFAGYVPAITSDYLEN